MFGLPKQQARLFRLLLVVGVAALAVAGFAAVQLSADRGPTFFANPYPDTPPAPDIELLSQDSTRFRLADLRGEPVLLFFGFTNCPDICPLTLDRLARVLSTDTSPAPDANLVMVSVDPLTDTPEILREYLTRFPYPVTGLTGSIDEVRAVMSQYGVYAEQEAHTGHGGSGAGSIAHTPVVFGIDREGQLQVLLHGDQPEEELRHDIRELAEAAS